MERKMIKELRDQVVGELADLCGKLLWESGRGRFIQWFYFGGRKIVTTFAGNQKETGEYSLEISCIWRISTSRDIIVASGDLYVPRDGAQAPGQDFDCLNPGVSLSDAKMEGFIRHECPLRVEGAEANNVGGFRLMLQRGFFLDVFPDYSTDDEHWRLVKPGDDPPHIILSGKGLEEQ